MGANGAAGPPTPSAAALGGGSQVLPCTSALHGASSSLSHLPCPPAAELADCSNKLLDLQQANETNANALGECRSHLTGVESLYSDCLRRTSGSS